MKSYISLKKTILIISISLLLFSCACYPKQKSKTYDIFIINQEFIRNLRDSNQVIMNSDCYNIGQAKGSTHVGYPLFNDQDGILYETQIRSIDSGLYMNYNRPGQIMGFYLR